MALASIINFSEAAKIKKNQINDELLKAAYAWAVAEQKRFAFVASPVRFDFDKDEVTYDREKVFVSFFLDRPSGRLIMRRDWDDGYLVKYNLITNYVEIAKIAPNALAQLLGNGVELYKRYLRAGV